MSGLSHTLLSALLLGFFIDTAHSQGAQQFVSPISARTSEGISHNEFPFSTTTVRRYMQIHSDLPANVSVIKALGFRANKSSTNATVGTMIEFELMMGSTVPYDSCSFYFDRNWIGAKKKVIAKKRFQFGPGVGSRLGPCPFSPGYDIKLDSPYVRTSAGSLGWEMLVHSNSGSGELMDADSSPYSMGLTFSYGTGCAVNGQNKPMSHNVRSGDKGGVLMMMFSGQNCPANAPCFVIIGTKQQALQVPGLCKPLYTNLMSIYPIGLAQANGDLNTEGVNFYLRAADGIVLLPNPGRLTLYTQLIAADAGRSGLPLALSNGLRIDTPPPNATRVVKVSRLFNHTGGVSAIMSAAFVRYSVGYGLPTRFTY